MIAFWINKILFRRKLLQVYELIYCVWTELTQLIGVAAIFRFSLPKLGIIMDAFTDQILIFSIQNFSLTLTWRHWDVIEDFSRFHSLVENRTTHVTMDGRAFLPVLFNSVFMCCDDKSEVKADLLDMQPIEVHTPCCITILLPSCTLFDKFT